MMRRRQQGFTLVEVLVTVVIVAIGLLSAAGLQIMSKKANFDATQRTAATALAQSIVARMRANPSQIPAYITADNSDATQLSVPGVKCDAAVCAPDQLAAFDLWFWGQEVLGVYEKDADDVVVGGLAFPSACVQNGVGGSVIVALAWRGITPVSNPADSEDPADPATNPCGINKGDYKGEGDEGNVTYRRVLVLETYIAPA